MKMRANWTRFIPLPESQTPYTPNQYKEKLTLASPIKPKSKIKNLGGESRGWEIDA